MKILAYMKTTLEADAKEFMELKKSMPPEEWERFKEDGRKNAEASGIMLEEDVPPANALKGS